MDLSNVLADIATRVRANALSYDWESLKAVLGDVAHQALIPLIEGEASDLRDFALGIGKDMVFAIMTGDHLWHQRLEGQLQALAELGRIRSNRAQWDFARQVLKLVFQAAVGAVGAVAKA